MRQAGRSLPEYREIRGTGSILDAIRDARAGRRDHPAAGAPLRRRRRHPLLRHRRAGGRHRLRRRHRARHRPGRRAARSARPADLDRLRPLEPEVDTPYVLETVRILVERAATVPLIGFAGAPFTVASYLIEGRPSRTYAATKALMHGEPALWHELMDRLADLAIASLRTQVEAGRLGRPALRQLGRRARAGPTTSASCCPTAAAGLRRRRRPRRAPHPLRRRHRRAARPRWPRPAPTWSGVDWRVTARRRPRAGSGRTRRCRATSTRPSAWPRGRRSRPAVRDVLARNGGHPGHVFNLGHGVLPETDPAVLERVVELVHAEGRADGRRPARPPSRAHGRVGLVVMAYGTPRHARRRRGLLHPHPPGSATDARAAGRAARPATTPSAASRRWPSAPRPSGPRSAARPRRARPRARSTVVLGQKHAAPFIEDARGRRWPTPASTGSSGLVLAPHYSAFSVGQYHERAAAAGAEHGRATAAAIDSLAPRARLPRLPRRRRCAEARATLPADHKVLFTAHSLPERVLVDDPYPDQLRESAAAVAERVGLLPVAGLGHRLAERRAHARAVAGPRHPRGDPRPGRHRPQRRACSCAPRASPPTTSRCSTTSTSRPRRVADELGPRLRPHPLAQRRPDGHGRAGRPGRRPGADADRRVSGLTDARRRGRAPASPA